MVDKVVETSGRTRNYRSAVRRARAEETRRRVVEAAAELFGRQGYVATTFTQLAEEAGVSVETVRKHGPKAALLRAAIELGSFGVEGERDVLRTDLGRTLVGLDDPAAATDFLGDMILTINAPAAPLWTAVLSTAYVDPEVAAFRDELLASVRVQATRGLEVFAQRGWLRDDVPFDELVEAFCVVTSVESYVRFVLVDRRPVEAYRDFVARTVAETIFRA